MVKQMKVLVQSTVKIQRAAQERIDKAEVAEENVRKMQYKLTQVKRAATKAESTRVQAQRDVKEITKQLELLKNAVRYTKEELADVTRSLCDAEAEAEKTGE